MFQGITMNQTKAWLACCLAMGFAGVANSAVVYTAKELGTLGGMSTSTNVQVNAFDLNDLGQVVGAAYVNTPYGVKFHAFMTGANGVGINDIGSQINAGNSAAYAVNNLGQVAGAYNLSGAGSGMAYMSGPGGTGHTDLGAGGSFSRASDINDAGQVTGYLSVASTYKAFVTGADGSSRIILGNGVGVSINQGGQVVANAGKAMFADTGATSLTSLGFESLLGGSTNGVDAINDHGIAVGWTGSTHYAFTYDVATHTKLKDIGVIGAPTATEDDIMDINNAGLVVGLDRSSGTDHAFIWGLEGSGKQNLDDLVALPVGIHLTSARGINNLGQIVANASDGKAYLLSPVPEPSTAMLAFVGVLGVGLVRSRRKPS